MLDIMFVTIKYTFFSGIIVSFFIYDWHGFYPFKQTFGIMRPFWAHKFLNILRTTAFKQI